MCAAYVLNELDHLLDAFLCDRQLGDAEGQVAALQQARRHAHAQKQSLKESVRLPVVHIIGM